MKGYRFYAELPEGKRRMTITQLWTFSRIKDGYMNCVALLTGSEHRSFHAVTGVNTQEAIVSAFSHANSDVACGAIAGDYLRRCRRISEILARKLHPALFAHLDKGD